MGNILMKIRKTLITDEYGHLTTWRGIVENKKHNINNIINNYEFPELVHQSSISTPEKPAIKRKPTSTPSGSRDRKMQAVHSPENNINNHEHSNSTQIEKIVNERNKKKRDDENS